MTDEARGQIVGSLEEALGPRAYLPVEVDDA